MIGVEEASASSFGEGRERCRLRSAAEVAGAAGSRPPPWIDSEELLNRNAVSIVGETAARYGHKVALTKMGQVPAMGSESNGDALMIGELIAALESKFKFGRK